MFICNEFLYFECKSETCDALQGTNTVVDISGSHLARRLCNSSATTQVYLRSSLFFFVFLWRSWNLSFLLHFSFSCFVYLLLLSHFYQSLTRLILWKERDESLGKVRYLFILLLVISTSFFRIFTPTGIILPSHSYHTSAEEREKHLVKAHSLSFLKDLKLIISSSFLYFNWTSLFFLRILIILLSHHFLVEGLETCHFYFIPTLSRTELFSLNIFITPYLIKGKVCGCKSQYKWSQGHRKVTAPWALDAGALERPRNPGTNYIFLLSFFFLFFFFWDSCNSPFFCVSPSSLF